MRKNAQTSDANDVSKSLFIERNRLSAILIPLQSFKQFLLETSSVVVYFHLFVIGDKLLYIIEIKIAYGSLRERNFNSLVQTYSNTTLPNCRRLILENGPKKYRVLRYIETSELRKVFKNRENKILSMIEVARKAENEHS